MQTYKLRLKPSATAADLTKVEEHFRNLGKLLRSGQDEQSFYVVLRFTQDWEGEMFRAACEHVAAEEKRQAQRKAKPKRWH